MSRPGLFLPQGTIRQRAILLALLPAAIIASALAFYHSVTGMDDLDSELRQRGITIVQYLGPASEYGVIAGNRGSLQALAQAAMQQPDVRAVVIADAHGRTLAISGRPSSLPMASQGGPDRAALVASGRGYLGFASPIRRSELDIDDFQDLVAPPAHGSEGIGRVYVELSSEDLQSRKTDLLLHTMLILAAGLLAAAVVALRIADSLSRPVSQLLGAVGRMAGGELGVRVDTGSAGELGELERGFNHMADRLQEMHDSMQDRIASATAQLAHQASHDPLTGLVNRREFEFRLAATLAARGEGAPYHILCYMDLDRFKVVNDSCGHAAGDELLRQITQLLRHRARSQDLLARLGGDEFALLLERCSLEDAIRVVESLRQQVEEFRFFWDEQAFSVGVSIGLVELDGSIHSLEDALGAADKACYEAKDQGRNRIQVFRREDGAGLRQQVELDWASRLNRALEDNRFLLYAQPVVPLVAGLPTVLRFEVFVRLLSERGEIVLPDTFLPAAERYHLAASLDRWVIDAACAGVRRLVDQSESSRVCCGINLSIQTVTHPDTLEYIRGRLEHHGIAAASLCFEIREDVVSRQLAEVSAFSQGLRRLGCGFAFDDFGSSVSSFSYLKVLAPDYVKIDGTLVRSMADDPVSRTLVRSIHDIGSQLNVMAVAEMIDDAAVFAQVRELGIEYGQGIWFEPPRLFEDWLSVCEARIPGGDQGIYAVIAESTS